MSSTPVHPLSLEMRVLPKTLFLHSATGSNFTLLIEFKTSKALCNARETKSKSQSLF